MPLQTQFRPFEVWTPLGTFDLLHARPDRPWGPLSFLESAYRLSFLGYCDRGVKLITHPHPAPRLRICRATPLLLLCARTACYERTIAFVVDLFARILIFVWLTYIPSIFFFCQFIFCEKCGSFELFLLRTAEDYAAWSVPIQNDITNFNLLLAICWDPVGR